MSNWFQPHFNPFNTTQIRNQLDQFESKIKVKHAIDVVQHIIDKVRPFGKPAGYFINQLNCIINRFNHLKQINVHDYLSENSEKVFVSNGWNGHCNAIVALCAHPMTKYLAASEKATLYYRNCRQIQNFSSQSRSQLRSSSRSASRSPSRSTSRSNSLSRSRRSWVVNVDYTVPDIQCVRCIGDNICGFQPLSSEIKILPDTARQLIMNKVTPLFDGTESMEPFRYFVIVTDYYQHQTNKIKIDFIPGNDSSLFTKLDDLRQRYNKQNIFQLFELLIDMNPELTGIKSVSWIISMIEQDVFEVMKDELRTKVLRFVNQLRNDHKRFMKTLNHKQKPLLVIPPLPTLSPFNNDKTPDRHLSLKAVAINPTTESQSNTNNKSNKTGRGKKRKTSHRENGDTISSHTTTNRKKLRLSSNGTISKGSKNAIDSNGNTNTSMRFDEKGLRAMNIPDWNGVSTLTENINHRKKDSNNISSNDQEEKYPQIETYTAKKGRRMSLMSVCSDYNE